jgi:hypothetical protein
MNRVRASRATLASTNVPVFIAAPSFPPTSTVNTNFNWDAATLDDLPPPTAEQIAALYGLKWSDGSTVVTVDNRMLTYEIYFALRQAELTQLLTGKVRVNPKLADDRGLYSDFHHTLDRLAVVFSKLERRQFPGTSALLSTFIYADELMTYLADIDNLRMAATAVQGIDPCRNCGSYSTIAISAQTRSADEPETRFVKCLACGESWKEN